MGSISSADDVGDAVVAPPVKDGSCDKDVAPEGEVASPCPEVVLNKILHGERSLAYSTAGDAGGTPVLFFYPAGGNRRQLHALHGPAVVASLRLICVNRPGKGGTSPAKENGPEAHIATACSDATLVLDALGVSSASLLFMCAGTPFALAFASRCSERVTGRLLGISAWVSPADSCEAKMTYRIGAALPSWLICPIVGKSMASINGSLTSLPTSTAVSALKSNLTPVENDAFDKANPDIEEYARKLGWFLEEAGGESDDIAVLLSSGDSIGVDYGSINGKVLLYHGEEDTMVPIEGMKWLAGQLPSAVLQELPQCSHNGAMFLLHRSVAESLITLVV